jgi:hypothetical protein
MCVNWDSNTPTISPCYDCNKIPKKKVVIAKIDHRWLMFCSNKCFRSTVKKTIKTAKEKL